MDTIEEHYLLIRFLRNLINVLYNINNEISVTKFSKIQFLKV